MLSRPTTIRLMMFAAVLLLAGGAGAIWFMTCDAESCSASNGAVESAPVVTAPVVSEKPVPASRMHIKKSNLRLKHPVDRPNVKEFHAPKKRNLAEEEAPAK